MEYNLFPDKCKLTCIWYFQKKISEIRKYPSETLRDCRVSRGLPTLPLLYGTSSGFFFLASLLYFKNVIGFLLQSFYFAGRTLLICQLVYLKSFSLGLKAWTCYSIIVFFLREVTSESILLPQIQMLKTSRQM